jgi:hypothetical protein
VAPLSAELREMPRRQNEALFAAQGAVLVFNTPDAAIAVHPQVIDVFPLRDVARTWDDRTPLAVAARGELI